MATITSNGVRLHYELGGSGEVPLVLVHGSWSSHRGWDLVAPGLRESFRVLTYDRRGHSRSERPGAQDSVREDVADLASLIEDLGLAPAWVAGNSFGGSIALRLAAGRPDLLRGVMAHEPPLFSLLADDPATAPMLEDVGRRVRVVVDRIVSGDPAGAAELFVDTVALGPGSWAKFEPDQRQTCIENAPTFLDETADPEQLAIDLAPVAAFPGPLLLSMGDRSPPMFPPVVLKLAHGIPRADVVTFPGAGHIPHVTHPDIYTEVITAFIRK